MPKKQTDVVTLSLKVGKSVLLGGLARLHMREGLPFSFTFYIANAVPIHPTTSDKAAATLAKVRVAMPFTLALALALTLTLPLPLARRSSSR